MLSKEKQIKNSLIYFISLGSSMILPMITLPVFTRILTKEDYGVLALAQAYAAFFTGLANFGMTIAYERNYYQYRDDPRKTAQLLYSTLGFVLTNFLVLAVFTYFFQSALSKVVMGYSQNGRMLFWALCAQIFSSAGYYYLTYFKNSESAQKFAFYSVGMGLMNVALSLLLVGYYRVGVIGIVYAQLVSSAVVFGVLSYKFTRSHPLAFSRQILIESLKISYPLTPRIFLGIVGTQFDKYLVGIMSSIGEVGIYSIGQKFSYMVFAFMTSIENVFTPQVYRMMFNLKEKGAEAIGRYLTPFLYASVLFGILTALFSEELITHLIPKSYHGAIDIVIILSMYYALMFFGKQPQLVYAKKTSIISMLTILGIFLNATILLPFVMTWKAAGAAWGTLVSSLISGGVTFALSQKYYKIQWEYRKIIPMFALFLGSAVLMVCLRHFWDHYPIRLVLKTVFLAGYVYLGFKIRVFSSENLGVIKNIFWIRRPENVETI